MTITQLNQETQRHLARSTAMMMVIFGITKGISLVQTFIIARFFGVGQSYDAYVTANRIPELIVVLIAGGALNYAFIPLFSSYLTKGDKARAWELASHVVNTVFSVALVVSVLVFFLTPYLVSNVIAPGFDAATTAETVNLMRLLLVGTVVFSVSGLVSGVLQSHNRFLLPALAPIMYDVGILFGVVVLLRPLGLTGVALGAVMGAFLHLFVQLPGLWRVQAQWKPRLGWHDPDLWRVVRLMIPRIIGLGVFQINFLVMTNIASRLGVGAISALDWGWRLMQIPQTLIGTAMGIVIFPTLASLSALGDADGKRQAMTGALRFILIACIPSAIGLIVIGQPLISLLEGGAFDATASVLVYGTLRAFMLGLIAHSVLEIVARSFYADGDTFFPLMAALVGAGVNAVLSFALSGVLQADVNSAFSLVGWSAPYRAGVPPLFGDVSGLAWANSIATAVEVSILLVFLRRRWRGIEEGTLASTALKALLASLVMALAVLAIEAGARALGLWGRGTLFTAVLVGGQAVVGAVVFFAVALALGMSEVVTIARLIAGKLLRAG